MAACLLTWMKGRGGAPVVAGFWLRRGIVMLVVVMVAVVVVVVGGARWQWG